MHVHEPRDDRLARDIDDARAARDLHLIGRAHSDDARAIDHDRAVRDHLVTTHRDEAGAGQRHDAAGTRLRHGERDLEEVALEDVVGLRLFFRFARRCFLATPFFLALRFLGEDHV